MSDTPKEESKSLLDALTDRIGHPVLGSFSIAFLIINWRIFVTLFGAGDASDKITAIERFIQNAGICSLLVEPAIIAVVYFFLLPYAGEKWIKKYQHSMETAGRNDRYRYTVENEHTPDNLFYVASFSAQKARQEIDQLLSTKFMPIEAPEQNVIYAIKALQAHVTMLSGTYPAILNQSRESLNTVQINLNKLDSLLSKTGERPLFHFVRDKLSEISTTLVAIQSQNLRTLEDVHRIAVDRKRHPDKYE